jgi:nitrogen fixation protein FixH
MTARSSAWIPWVFVGGMALVVAVNAALVFASVSTFAGVAVGRAYERGRGYEAVLAEAARQDALGWSVDVALSGAGILLVEAHDRDGRPIEGRLAGTLQRPAGRDGFALEPEAVAPGRWAAPIAGAHRGQWDVRLAVTGPNGAVVEARRRVVLP